MKFAVSSILATLFTLLSFAQAQDEIPFRFYRTPLPNKNIFKPTVPHLRDDRVYLFGNPVLPIGIALERKKWAKHFIEYEASQLIESVFTSPHWDALRESSRISWKPIERIPLVKLLQDLSEHNYSFSSQCHDENGTMKEASTLNGTLRAKVCFDIGRMLKTERAEWDEYWMRAKLAGLVLHEHLRHFNVMDDDNFYYNAFASYAEYFLKHESPEPETILIPKEFIEIRNQFRDAGETIKLNQAAVLSCTIIWRDLKTADEKTMQMKRDITNWFAQPLSLSQNILSEDQIDITSMAGENQNPNFYVTNKLGLFDQTHLSGYVMNPFRTIWESETLSINSMSRYDGASLFMELSLPEGSHSAISHVPGVVFLKQNALAYVKCKKH